jgi:hypothetical protein
MRATVARYGVERYMRSTLSRIPADARAFADPEIAAAFLAGAEKLIFAESFSVAAFAAELALLHQDWPEQLGQVALPSVGLRQLPRRRRVRRARALARGLRPDRSLPCADAAALTQQLGWAHGKRAGVHRTIACPGH